MDCAATTDQSGCTHCLQPLNEMKDPRELPCMHVACMSCLESDRELTEKGCRACSEPIDVKQLQSFTPVPALAEAASDGSDTSSTELCCSICEDSTPAVSYCNHCEKKMCNTHEQNHRAFFKDEHKLISIQKYSEKPKFFIKLKCEAHPQSPIIMACQSCQQLLCSCCTSKKCANGSEHRCFSVEVVAADIKSKLEQMMTQCSDKVIKFRELEKQTWQFVDSLTDKCEAMIDQVEKTAEQQITEIRAKSQSLKQQIVNYENGRLDEVGQFITDLQAKVNDLEGVQAETRLFLLQNNPSNVVQKQDEKFSELKAAIDTDIKTVYDDAGKDRVLLSKETITSVRSVKCPKGNYCRSLEFSSSGMLLVSCSDNAVLLDSDSYEVSQCCSTPLNIHSLSQSTEQNMYMLYADEDVYKLEKNLQEKTLYAHLPQKSYPSHKSKLRVSQRYIVVTNRSTHLHIRNHDNTVLGNYNLPGTSWVRSLCFHRDGNLVILDSEKGNTSMYQLSETAEPKLIWTCDQFKGAYAVCSDYRTRLIYVTSRGKTLHILSHEGEILKTLVCADLPFDDTPDTEFCDIAVSDNNLITTQFMSKVLKVFKLGF